MRLLPWLFLGTGITLFTISVTLTALVTVGRYHQAMRRAKLRGKIERRLREMGLD
jgi:hypothetical protein